MRIKAFVVGALLLVPFAIAEAGASKTIRKSVPLDANGRLSIDTHNGSITVTTWQQPSVEIDARIEAADSDYPEDVDKTKVKITGGRSEVSIESDYSDVGEHALGWFGFGSERMLPPIHYTIRMPATARLMVDDHNASVRIVGLRNDLTVHSHNGSVEARDLDGAANIETHNGSVQLGFARFGKSSSIETHNGSCEVAMPHGARFTLNVDAHRHDPVQSDFAMVRGRSTDESSYSAAVNGGGPELRFESHNGSLRVAKK